MEERLVVDFLDVVLVDGEGVVEADVDVLLGSTL